MVNAPLAANAGAITHGGERRYANHLCVGFNRLEFLLDFAQAYHGQDDFVHTHLVAAPAHLKAFVALLQGCLADYERRYGAIATTPESPGAFDLPEASGPAAA